MDSVQEIIKAITEYRINRNTYKIEDYDKNIEDLDNIDPKDFNSDTIIVVKTVRELINTERRLKEEEERKHEQKDHEWKCNLCQKQYGCIKELKEHEKKEHEWKCDECKN